MTGRGKGDLVEKLILPPPRFVGAALLPLVEAIGNDELAVHETWLAVRDSVEAELSRWSTIVITFWEYSFAPSTFSF